MNIVFKLLLLNQYNKTKINIFMNKHQKEITVSILDNELQQYNEEITISIKRISQFQDFLDICSKKLKIIANRVFDEFGIEIFDLETLLLLDKAFLSEG